ncbi:hypothetical protein COBT_003606, partial [Conglomerata obtusa]
KDYECSDIEELYENEYHERLCESFMDKYFLSEDNKNLVSEIIKLCYFIAKNNNEIIEYVMTDKQLLDLIYTKPLNREDFIDCLGRMCLHIREHMYDLILIIKKLWKQITYIIILKMHKKITLNESR